MLCDFLDRLCLIIYSISCKGDFLDQLSVFRSVVSVTFSISCKCDFFDQLSVFRSVVSVTFSISCA